MNFNHRRNQSNDDSLYKELGLSRQSSQSEIKKAYHKLALKKHPDKGGNVEEFKKIQGAYEILSDPEKRQQYDTYGLEVKASGRRVWYRWVRCMMAFNHLHLML